MLIYLYGWAKQGQWLRCDSAMQVDTSWKKLLYVWTPELLSFQINAIHDQLPSPANLRLWGKNNLGLCQLCNHRNCTLLHILNCCSYSLQNGRCNWRPTKLSEQLQQVWHHTLMRPIEKNFLQNLQASSPQSHSEQQMAQHLKPTTTPAKG